MVSCSAPTKVLKDSRCGARFAEYNKSSKVTEIATVVQYLDRKMQLPPPSRVTVELNL